MCTVESLDISLGESASVLLTLRDLKGTISPADDLSQVRLDVTSPNGEIVPTLQRNKHSDRFTFTPSVCGFHIIEAFYKNEFVVALQINCASSFDSEVLCALMISGGQVSADMEIHVKLTQSSTGARLKGAPCHVYVSVPTGDLVFLGRGHKDDVYTFIPVIAGRHMITIKYAGKVIMDAPVTIREALPIGVSEFFVRDQSISAGCDVRLGHVRVNAMSDVVIRWTDALGGPLHSDRAASGVVEFGDGGENAIPLVFSGQYEGDEGEMTKDAYLWQGTVPAVGDHQLLASIEDRQLCAIPFVALPNLSPNSKLVLRYAAAGDLCSVFAQVKFANDPSPVPLSASAIRVTAHINSAIATQRRFGGNTARNGDTTARVHLRSSATQHPTSRPVGSKEIISGGGSSAGGGSRSGDNLSEFSFETIEGVLLYNVSLYYGKSKVLSAVLDLASLKPNHTRLVLIASQNGGRPLSSEVSLSTLFKANETAQVSVLSDSISTHALQFYLRDSHGRIVSLREQGDTFNDNFDEAGQEDEEEEDKSENSKEVVVYEALPKGADMYLLSILRDGEQLFTHKVYLLSPSSTYVRVHLFLGQMSMSTITERLRRRMIVFIFSRIGSFGIYIYIYICKTLRKLFVTSLSLIDCRLIRFLLPNCTF